MKERGRIEHGPFSFTDIAFEGIGTHVQAMDLDLCQNFEKLFGGVVACFNALPPPGPADYVERLPLRFRDADRLRTGMKLYLGLYLQFCIFLYARKTITIFGLHSLPLPT